MQIIKNCSQFIAPATELRRQKNPQKPFSHLIISSLHPLKQLHFHRKNSIFVAQDEVLFTKREKKREVLGHHSQGIPKKNKAMNLGKTLKQINKQEREL